MQHEYHRCPVTALAFSREKTLLAGEGNYLRVYKLNPNKHKQSVKVFDDQAVHGIIVADHGRLALIWGGRFVRIATISGEGTALDPVLLGDLQTLDDWILDAAFAAQTEGYCTKAALVTAHNALWTLQTDYLPSAEDQGTASATVKRAICGSNCILYSAHDKWLSASHCLVASGTAFGDIVLWSAFLKEGGARSETHSTFSAHEGSVFGVQISSSLRLPGEDVDRRLLASCSDDRTIRLWDVTDLSAQSPNLTELQRDTGFGSRTEADTRAPPLLAKVMGHTSRIWHVRFCQDTTVPEGINPRIISCGEDAFVNTWTLKSSSAALPYVLEQINAKSAHAGKNIWSVAQHDTGAVVTGGADGAIARFPVLQNPPVLADIERHHLQEEAGSSTDNYKAYAFVSNDTLISTTEQGRVILVEVNDAGNRISELSSALPGLRGCSVVASLEGKAFVSGTDGAVYTYTHASTESKGMKLSKIMQRTGKTAGLFVAKLGVRGTGLLVTSVGARSASVLLSHDARVDNILEAFDVEEQHLALPPGSIVTSFAVFAEGDVVYVFLGTRTGSFLIYSFATSHAPSNITESCLMRDMVHGKEAVTALLAEKHWEERSKSKRLYVFSTGRDGTLAVHRLNLTSPSPSLELIHQLSLPFGPNIEGIHISPTLGYLSVWGFKSKHFVLYDTWSQQETLSVECGGAHRNWAFQPLSHGRGGAFVWTKASKVQHYSQESPTCRMVSSGGHGREVKAVAVSQGVFEDGGEIFEDGGRIIATGAEDTDIKLFRFRHRYGHFGALECLQTLRKHNTGIQHLAWDGEYLFSSGGFEEFFVWRVSAHVPRCVAAGVVCESEHPRSGKSDLRICGFDVKSSSNAGSEGVGFDISMAYSDSTLKLWRYQSGRWEMLGAGDYLTSCLTHVLRPTCQGGRIITAATDGHLAVWKTASDGTSLAWHTRHKVHQSAIHALTSIQLTDGSILLATGGDDNAIALTRLSPDGTLQTLLMPRAHAAAATGLVLLKSNEGRFLLASASIDQRIKLWRIDVDPAKSGVEGIEIGRVQNVFTSVADVSGLEICTLEDGRKGLLVCGVGMDVWRLPDDTDESLRNT